MPNVLKWDLGNIPLQCYHPLTRHDVLPWHSAPPYNAIAAMAGRSYGFHALRLEAKGDWPWYSLVFNFPVMQLATCVGGAAHQNWKVIWHTGTLAIIVGGDRAYTEEGSS